MIFFWLEHPPVIDSISVKAGITATYVYRPRTPGLPVDGMCRVKSFNPNILHLSDDIVPLPVSNLLAD